VALGARPRRRPGVWFLPIFLGILAGFYVFGQLGVFSRVVAPASLRASALAAAPIIRLLGDPVTVEGVRLSSARGAVDVALGCDALEPIVYFVAAVVAFPAPWRRRVLGVVLGIPALFLLNAARIAGLYLVLTRRPAWFETAHIDVSQPLFILVTFGTWFAWVMLLSNNRRTPEKNATPFSISAGEAGSGGRGASSSAGSSSPRP
jgi:exosortase/archaeosortase family protein